MALVWNAIRLTLTSISRNKTRAGLTVLGILIGVSAVIVVVALGAAASDKVGGEIDGFASNAVFINPQPTQQSGARGKTLGRLTENDGKAILREAVSISNLAPFLGAMGQVVYMDKNASTYMVGTTLSYFPIRKWHVAKGELWTEGDELIKSKVCILGASVVERLFVKEDPIGRTIRIGRSPFRVIGVLAPRGSSVFGDDQDDRVLIPIGSFRARVVHTSPGRVDQLMASSTSAETVVRAQRQIEEILRQRHHIESDREADFVVNSMAEFREAEEGIASALQALLFGVAAVSLLVGGIGVMNIMLVSVAERTREIGIRMSIGAREGDILMQFMIEAVVLSLIGGLLGILLGGGAVAGIGHALNWPMYPSLQVIVIAVGTSATIGIVFGFLPARRAAKLDPIEALRTE